MATISARELERVVPPAVQLKRRWGSLLKHAVLIALSIAFVFPLYWLITTSLKPSSQVIMIPSFILFKVLGWVGSLYPLIIPPFFGSAFNIFLLRQFFMTIPQELSEAARVDGANELTIFWRVILPLAKPALATVALFQFIFAW